MHLERMPLENKNVLPNTNHVHPTYTELSDTNKNKQIIVFFFVSDNSVLAI